MRVDTTEHQVRAMIDDLAADFARRELAWLPSDRRGRWVVLESGAGRLLRDSPAAIRRRVDRMTPRRVRRFSSLSRARSFAHQVGGTVHRWRRTAPGGGVWQRWSPWQWATRNSGLLYLPSTEIA